MLIGQASINLTANLLSALFRLARLFSPRDYGVYLLGVGFASVVSGVLVSWLRNLILSGDDGPDVRGVVISGYRDGLAVASPKCLTDRSIIKRLARFQRPAKRICVWNEGCHALSGNWGERSNASN